MKRFAAYLICGVWLTGSQVAFAAEDLTFIGACDASAAIVSASGEIAVADDENPDVVRLYNLAGRPSPLAPTAEVPLEDHLQQKKPRKEADLEGVAVVGERAYWIGSHSRDKKGKLEVERRALFATDLNLKPVGTAYRSLLDALVDGDKAWRVGLAEAIGDVNEHADCADSDDGRQRLSWLAVPNRGVEDHQELAHRGEARVSWLSRATVRRR